ncbi:hypothetical protein L9F63_002140, partial [Diploptera punctata]
ISFMYLINFIIITSIFCKLYEVLNIKSNLLFFSKSVEKLYLTKSDSSPVISYPSAYIRLSPARSNYILLVLEPPVSTLFIIISVPQPTSLLPKLTASLTIIYNMLIYRGRTDCSSTAISNILLWVFGPISLLIEEAELRQNAIFEFSEFCFSINNNLSICIPLFNTI